MTNIDTKRLLEKYRLGKCTPAEKSLVESWYAYEAQRLSASAEHTDLEKSKNQIWNAILRDEKAINRKAGFKIIQRWAVAASLLLFLTCGLLGYHFRQSIHDYLNPEKFTVTSTVKAEMKQLKLSDGTTILLNANSKIKYPETFNRNTRIIELVEGEAFFDIVHDAKKPFIVFSKGIKTQVLGTAFNIRSYTFLNGTQISVTRGKVSVTNSPGSSKVPASMVLLPNEQVFAGKNTSEFVKSNVNSSDIISWTNGGLNFSNESFEHISKILENKFGTAIKLKEESLKSIYLSGHFKASESLNDILNIICLPKHLTYKSIDNVIIISSR